MDITDISHSEEIYTVSRLNREARLVLEGSFPIFWIEGEISNFVAPQSGHWYFSLKDATAQIRCAMFKPQNRRLTLTPKDGMHVLLKARVSLYEGRGDFQLLIEAMEEAGVGKLQQAFEALKKRLAAAGLFATERKRNIPTFPKQIGVITSATGAAIRDILHVLRRRYAAAPVIIYPTLVQGELAAANIVNAIQTANERNECDILIIARGGGSLEDLWPFNEEIVAQAIFQSKIPTITGIGHEIDFTIADFVADVRAPTPSAAAELVTPDKTELLLTLEQKASRLTRAIKQHLHRYQQQLLFATKQLQQQHPKRRLMEQAQHLDQLELTLKRLQHKKIQDIHASLRTYHAKLNGLTPTHAIQRLKELLARQQQSLQSGMNTKLHHQQSLLANYAAKLDTLSPLATLQRGFAIVTATKNGQVMRDTQQTRLGDQLTIQLMKGELLCSVEKISDK